MQGYQANFNSIPEGELIEPEKCTDLISWNYPVGPLERVEIEQQEENKLETVTEIEETENTSHERYYSNCLHSSPYKRLIPPTQVKTSFKKLLSHQIYRNECRE